MGVSLNGGTPQNTPKWSFLVGKPMVVGYHHFRKPPYILESCRTLHHSYFNVEENSSGADDILWSDRCGSWDGRVALLRSRHFDLEEGCEKFAQAFFSVDLRSNKFMFTEKDSRSSFLSNSLQTFKCEFENLLSTENMKVIVAVVWGYWILVCPQ